MPLLAPGGGEYVSFDLWVLVASALTCYYVDWHVCCFLDQLDGYCSWEWDFESPDSKQGNS